MRTEKVEMRPVLKYPGSKWKMAEWIISLMPPHKSYLEPFFGSGAVFFKKEPSRIETINDMDGEIVNLFRCIREEPEELMRCVTMTPYSRAEYEQAWGKFRFRAGVPSVGVEAARMTLVRYWQSHGSTSVYKGGWKNDRADQEHDAWVCGKCGYIENFEADGPEENGWRFCPACGREIVIADETSELTEKQWGWILGRFSRAE